MHDKQNIRFYLLFSQLIFKYRVLISLKLNVSIIVYNKNRNNIVYLKSMLSKQRINLDFLLILLFYFKKTLLINCQK
jgi:hypothetical protein